MNAQLIGAGKVREKLAKVGQIARKPLDGVRGRLVLRRIRQKISQEFSSGRGFGPGGGQQTWKRTQPFDDRPATVPPLGGASSSLAAAWGGGPGGFQTFGPRLVRFGVILPYARIHREGGAIDVTPRMRAFLHYRDVHLKPSKRTIVIPKRAHADMRAPVFREAARGVIVEAITEASR